MPQAALVHSPRWMSPEDYAEAAGLDDGAGAWSVDSFAAAFSDTSVRGIVFDGGRQSATLRECDLFAWVVYRFDREAVRVLRLAVNSKFRRRGIGNLLLRYALMDRTDFKGHRGYRFCSASVSESDSVGQWLFRRFGLQCVGFDESGFRFAGLV